jgi:hypothetical protein
MPVGGGEERQVVPGIPDWDSFAVTARGLYFLSDRKTLRLLDEKTGLVRGVARLEGHSADEGITVSGDDAFVIFSQADHRVDLMLVEGFR